MTHRNQSVRLGLIGLCTFAVVLVGVAHAQLPVRNTAGARLAGTWRGEFRVEGGKTDVFAIQIASDSTGVQLRMLDGPDFAATVSKVRVSGDTIAWVATSPDDEVEYAVALRADADSLVGRMTVFVTSVPPFSGTVLLKRVRSGLSIPAPETNLPLLTATHTAAQSFRNALRPFALESCFVRYNS